MMFKREAILMAIYLSLPVTVGVVFDLLWPYIHHWYK